MAAIAAEVETPTPAAVDAALEPNVMLAGDSARRLPSSSWLERLAILAIAAVAYALRLHDLGAQSLWLDEGLSVAFARLAIPDLLAVVVERDIHPPLHVLALHFWFIVAGSSEFAARWLSAAAGALLTPVVWALGRSLFRSRGADLVTEPIYASAPLVAAALIAASPFLLYFSQEARGYTSLALLTTAASYALWRGVTTGSTGAWVAYALLTAAALLTHYYAGLVVVFHALFVFGQPRRWPQFGLAVVGMVVCYLPWLGGLTAQLWRLWRQPDFWPGAIDAWAIVGRTFSAFTLGHQDRWLELAPIVFGLGALFVVGAALAWRRREHWTAAGFLWLYLIVPAAALYAITANNPKFSERYLIALAPPVALLLARAVTGPARWAATTRPDAARWQARGPGGRGWLRSIATAASLALVVAVVSASLWGAVAVYNAPLYAKDDHRGAVAYIDHHAEPGDIVILLLDTTPTFTYYQRGATPRVGFDSAQDLNVVIDDVNRAVAGRQRAWLLLWQAHWADRHQLLTGLFQDQAVEVPVDATFRGLTLRLFTLPPTGFTLAPPNQLSAGFERRVEFLGYGSPSFTVAAGAPLQLGLYWRPLQALGDDLTATITLRDADGHVWGVRSAPPSGYHLATSEWELGDWIFRGQFDLPVDAGAPPGTYSLELSLADLGAKRVWRVFDDVGNPLSAYLTLPTPVTVLRPTPRPTTNQLPMMPPNVTIQAGAADPVTLVGVAGAVEGVLTPGAAIDLTTYWRANGSGARPRTDIVISVETGGSVRQLWRGPLAPGYPVETWVEGDIVALKSRLVTPIDLEPGQAMLLVAYSIAGAQITSGEASVTIAPIPRRFVASMPGIEQVARFGDFAELRGFDLQVGEGPVVGNQPIAVSTTDRLMVRLHWRAAARTDRDYKVFVHLARASGAVEAQTDAEPVDTEFGHRPTSVWLPNEAVIDGHTLDLNFASPGVYDLRIGLYLEATGQRLPLTAGDIVGADFLRLNGARIEVAR